MLKRFLMLLLLSLLAITEGAVGAKPPTVDPTYGFPVPRLQAPVQVAMPTQWIWVEKTQDTQTVNARGLVTLSASPSSATLFVTGDDAATVFVNGHKVVTTDAVESGWKQVHRESVTSLLHAGINSVAIQGVNSGGSAGILAQLDVNGKTVLQSGPHWKVLASSSPPAEWTEAGFDDSHWTDATAIASVGLGPWGASLDNWPATDASAWYLAHLPVYPVAIDVLSGKTVGAAPSAGRVKARGMTINAVATGDAPASLRIDFGKEIAGRLILQGTPGTVLRVTTGETIAELTHAEPALDNSGPYTLTLTGDSLTTTPYSAFRYAQLVFPSRQAATLTRVECDHKYYPVAYKGAFDCSDPLLTKIWYAGAYTAHLCMQEDIWDAPKRDRGLWGGDLHVTGATINDVFADRFLMEHSIAGLPKIAPGVGGNPAQATGDINILPGYTAAWFCELADLYRCVGDNSFLKSQQENILALLAYQHEEFDAAHLFTNPHHEWNFVDWAPDFIQDSPQSHMAVELFDIKGIQEAVFLLRALGDTANANKYDAWGKTLTDAARQNYPDASTSTYGDRLQTNVMAIYSGVATPAQREAIYTRILRADNPAWTPPTSAANTAAYPMSPYYGSYVLRAFGDLERQQDGLDLIRRYWGAMMARGTTALWEQFDPTMPTDMNKLLDMTPYVSFSHGWSTGPTSFLSEYVLGVRSTSGGMKTVEIVPFLGDLKWIDGAVPAPSGLIRVRASKAAGGQVITLELPPDIDAQVGLSGSTIFVNGRSCPIVRQAGGISYVRLSKAGVYQLKSSGEMKAAK